MVTVVHVRTSSNWTRYIGRKFAEFEASPLGNPFHLRQYHGSDPRMDCLADFAVWWYAPEQKHLREYALAVIKLDEILGGWCHPLMCHGDIIAGYVNWKRAQAQGRLF